MDKLKVVVLPLRDITVDELAERIKNALTNQGILVQPIVDDNKLGEPVVLKQTTFTRQVLRGRNTCR